MIMRELRGHVSEIARSFTGALLSEALTVDEKMGLTIRLYNLFPSYRGGALPPWKGTLAPWEETWFRRRLPESPGRILVGACGAGREVVGLLEKGFIVDAFDPAPELVSSSTKTVWDRARVSTFSYEDLSASVLDGAPGAASVFAHQRYDAVLLGWGSLTHVLDSEQRLRLLRALDTVCPAGPILASFWCTNGYAPKVPARGRLHHCGQAIGRKLAALRGVRGGASSGLSFAFHRGFGYIFTPEEVEDLGASVMRKVEWELDATTYAHVTFLPRSGG